MKAPVHEGGFTSGMRLRVLLLEDNPDDAELLRDALAKSAPGDFAVTWVERLVDALVGISTGTFDAMLSDLHLPDSDGVATVQAIAARAPRLPLVVLTGQDDEGLGREAIQRGAQDYLVKGKADGALVVRALRYAIERKRLELGLRAANDALARRVAERTADLEAANAALRAEAARDRALMQTANEGIITTDADGVVLRWNPAAGRMFGYTQAEMVGKPVALLMPQRYRDAHGAALQSMNAGGERRGVGATVELHGLTRDGREFPIELSLSAWETDEGQFFTAFVRDVGERKRMVDALHASEARFRSLTELSADWYWEQDRQFRQTFRSDDEPEKSGAADAPAIGATRWDVPALNLSEADWAQHRAALERRESFRDFEIERANKQGGTSWISISGTPIYDASGNFCGYRGVGRNITERKRSEIERAQLAAIVEGSGDAIMSRTLDGTLITWNAAAERMFGYSAEEAIGRDLGFLIPSQDWERVATRRSLVEQGHPVPPFDAVRVAKDGRHIDVSIALSPVRDAGSRVVAVSQVMHDVGERRRAEQALTRQKDLYNALYRTNEAIVRATSRDELFQTVCRIAVEQGHFLFAWIGLVETENASLKAVARFGVDGGYLDVRHAAASGSNSRRPGLVQRAIESGVHAFTNDFLGDPDTAPWHEAARPRGVRAFASLPIRQSGEVVGAINVYAGTPGIFDDDLLATLDAMAIDVSFALDTFQRGAERRHAIDALRDSEQRFRSLVEQSIAGIVILDQDRIVYANPRCAEIVGYAQEDLVGRSTLEFIDDGYRAKVADLLRQLTSGAIATARHDFRAVRKDGVGVDLGAHASRSIYQGRTAIVAVVQDISEKKRAEEQILRYMAQLESAFMSTVEVATTLSEMRDPYTAGHERRVAEIAVAIGAELGFDTRRQEGLRVAGYLHDIGKITIPAEILAKPGRLSAIEFSLIQGHPQASYEVLKPVAFPWPVAEAALQHHERMDGSGYPQGLKGEAILLEARILAVTDVVEAMSSHRPYRPGLGIEAALAEIERGRGTAYDTAVADACLRLFRDKGYAVPA